MKKVIILALIVLSLVIVGCAPQPADELNFDAITEDVTDINSALDSDLAELDALDQDLAELEALDLG